MDEDTENIIDKLMSRLRQQDTEIQKLVQSTQRDVNDQWKIIGELNEKVEALTKD